MKFLFISKHKKLEEESEKRIIQLIPAAASVSRTSRWYWFELEFQMNGLCFRFIIFNERANERCVYFDRIKKEKKIANEERENSDEIKLYWNFNMRRQTDSQPAIHSHTNIGDHNHIRRYFGFQWTKKMISHCVCFVSKSIHYCLMSAWILFFFFSFHFFWITNNKFCEKWNYTHKIDRCVCVCLNRLI